MEEMVTITKKEYETLKARVDWLEWLEAVGVDSWGGYEYAQGLREVAS